MIAVPQYVLLAVGGLSGAVMAALYAFQEKLLYHPSIPAREYSTYPNEYLMEYEDVEIVADDGTKLHAWLIKQAANASRAAATFVYFHGNAGNIGDRCVHIALSCTIPSAFKHDEAATDSGFAMREASRTHGSFTRADTICSWSRIAATASRPVYRLSVGLCRMRLLRLRMPLTVPT